MSIEVRVPPLPESVADATLVAWHKKAGEPVGRDENLVDLETDKVVLEVPSPISGVIREIKVQNGTTVVSGQVLAILEDQTGAAVAVPAANASSAARPASTSTPAPEGAASKSGPAVKRMVEEHQLQGSAIAGTGKDGRLTKGDVLAHLSTQKAPTPATTPAPTPAVELPVKGERNEHRVPMTRLRARIAERLVQAQATAAMLTTFNEVDLTAVNEIRARHKERFEKTHSVKLGFTSFFVKAVIEALRKFPAVNASVEGSDIIYHEYYDIGVAVSTDRGLLVPVMRNAEHMSFAQIESAVGSYAQRARSGAITLEELSGGTFTLTNGGVFGSLMSTPILNPPQVAILGMHKVQDRPVVVNGQVVVRPMMYLALTYDHRIVDGRESVQFLVAIKEALEDPSRLLLQL